MPGGFEELNAKITRLKRGGGVGYTEGGTKSLTFDGDLTGKESILVGEVGAETQYLVKLSDITFDTSDFIGATFVSRNITSGEADAKRITDASFEDIGFGYNVRDGENLLFAIVTEDTEAFTKGIWAIVARVDGSWYGCIQIDYNGEIIHLIDPKYLPEGFGGGGGLPVVNLSEDAMLSLTDGSGQFFPLSDADSKQMDAVVEKGLPCVIQTGFAELVFSFVCNLSAGMYFGDFLFVTTVVRCVITKQEGVWVAGSIVMGDLAQPASE